MLLPWVEQLVELLELEEEGMHHFHILSIEMVVRQHINVHVMFSIQNLKTKPTCNDWCLILDDAKKIVLLKVMMKYVGACVVLKCECEQNDILRRGT